MFPILQLGPLAINTPGLIFLIGLWLGLLLTEKKALIHGIEPNLVYHLSSIVLISGVIGARLFFVILHWSAFESNLLSIFSLNYKLLDMWGGIVVGLIVFLWYIQKTRLAPAKIADVFVPAFSILAIASNMANLATGNEYGLPTSLPWGIELFGVMRHPTQIYEVVTALLILWSYLKMAAKFGNKFPEGSYFLIFLSLTSLSRIFWEAFRADSVNVVGNLHINQLVAWMVMTISLWLLRKRIKIFSEQLSK